MSKVTKTKSPAKEEVPAGVVAGMRKVRDYHAKMVLYGIPDMKPPSVKRIAAWLRKQADEIEGNPKKHSRVATYRLMKR